MLGPMPQREIDDARAGVLTMVPAVVGDLLRLPKTLEVVGARMGARGTIELLIVGAEMPPRPSDEDGEPERVTLVAHALWGPDGERVTLNWAHLPDQEWVLR